MTDELWKEEISMSRVLTRKRHFFFERRRDRDAVGRWREQAKEIERREGAKVDGCGFFRPLDISQRADI